MIQPLEFRFALTKDEFVRGVRAFYLRQPITWIFLAAFGIFAIVQWMVFDAAPTMLTLTALLPMLLYLGFLFVVMPWLLGRQVARNERMRVEMTLRITEDRIAVSTPYTDSSMDWGTFHRVITTPEAYLLVFSTNKNMFQILPKRALATPEQAAAFERLLAQKLSGPPAASA